MTPAGINTVFKKQGTIYFCESCQLFSLGSQPSPEELKNFYTESYYSAPEKNRLIYLLRSRFSLLRAWSQYRFVERNLGNRGPESGRSVLEIGSSDGSLLSIFQKHGWKIRGLEFSSFSVRKAREKHGIELEENDIFDLDPGKDKFDIIALSHVLEHMPDPIRVLEHCKQLLTPHGHIFVELPLAPLGHECTGEEFGLYLNTTHLYDFRPEALENLAGRAGLETETLERYFYHIPGILGKYSSAIGRAFMIGSLPMSRPMELFAVILAAIIINVRFTLRIDPLMTVDINAPWRFGDVLRVMLSNRNKPVI
jgi:2-polyprenyl-3-methyl-5-hydroxy-6-metoxy-1,4-benzoquinol methylase